MNPLPSEGQTPRRFYVLCREKQTAALEVHPEVVEVTCEISASGVVAINFTGVFLRSDR